MRKLVGLVVVVALVALGVFFADHPGQVRIVWQGWLIETSLGVLIAAAFLAALAVVVAIRLIALIIGGPAVFGRRRRERRRRAGYRALTQGMVAVAAGEPDEARRYARKADLLLAEPPLTLLLSAQSAQLDGDTAAAKKFFTAMLERPETEFLGLRGLINQALSTGERDTALRLAERARRLRPSTPWVATALIDLQTRAGMWPTVQSVVADAAKRRLLPPERARHNRGVVLFELARAARPENRQRAVALAAQARALVPDLAAPAARHASWLFEDGRPGPAAKAVERAWRTAPQPELARVFGTIYADEPPLARVKRFERLARQNPEARESHLAVAEAALEARLWGEARRRLDQALAAAPPPYPDPSGQRLTPTPSEAREAPLAGATPRLCLMIARLEDAEFGAVRMREWLDRAVAALPDPRYVCAQCGGETLDWQALCPHCESFDTLSWRTPARPAAALAAHPVVTEITAPAAPAEPVATALAAAPEQDKSNRPAPVAQR